jgi:hypothetical protein
VKLFAIPAGSAYDLMDLESSDTLARIDGAELRRRGDPLTLRYIVVQ